MIMSQNKNVLNIGLKVTAKYDGDGKFYQAFIKEVDDYRYTVFFPFIEKDGTTQSTKRSDIKLLQEEVKNTRSNEQIKINKIKQKLKNGVRLYMNEEVFLQKIKDKNKIKKLKNLENKELEEKRKELEEKEKEKERIKKLKLVNYNDLQIGTVYYDESLTKLGKFTGMINHDEIGYYVDREKFSLYFNNSKKNNKTNQRTNQRTLSNKLKIVNVFKNADENKKSKFYENNSRYWFKW